MNRTIQHSDLSVAEAAFEEIIPYAENLPPLPELKNDQPLTRSFGIVDLWNIRRVKRHFSIYRNRR